VATGATVLAVAGTHFELKAGSRFILADRRVLTFPVEGTDRSNAVMRAQDQSGKTLLHFRAVQLDQDPFRHFSQRSAVEVAVSPDEHITLQLLWVMGRSFAYLFDYFQFQGQPRLS
jgi:hypothetical protein